MTRMLPTLLWVAGAAFAVGAMVAAYLLAR